MTRYFTYKSLDELRADVTSRGLDVPLTDDLGPLLQPVAIGPRTVGNRMVVHPMEGCDGTLGGEPGELTFRRWERFGAGGAKVIWGEATAVVPEARANPRQLLLNETTAPAIGKLLETARKAHNDRFGRTDDFLVGIQLTHSGRWSYPSPLIATHLPAVEAVKHIELDAPVLNDGYLEALEEKYIEAAMLARNLGFDFVDIKQCHSYLLNELLAGHDRKGTYGGDFEGRSRFVTNVFRRIHDRAPDLLLATRLNVYDGPPYSGDAGQLGVPAVSGSSQWGAAGLDEPLRLVAHLRDLGLSLLNVSMGSPYYNPHISRPFERAPVDGYVPPEHPLEGVERHLQLSAQVQTANPDLAVIGTGYSWLRHYAANAGAAAVAEARVSMMGLGRGALAYPDFAADIAEHGAMVDRKSCIGISYCTALMRAKNNEMGQFPAGCAPRDPYYAEQFKVATGR